MFNTTRRIIIGSLLAAGGAAALTTAAVDAQGVKITDPTSVVMIVNRDSNDIGFMDIKSRMMTTAFATSRLNGIWSAVCFPSPKWIGASRCVPPCSGAENANAE